MGIGLGIVLILLGLILVSGVVSYDINFVQDQTLGWILLIVGALALVLTLVMNQQRSHSTHIEERRVQD
jgi:cell division protein FtsW (lipid II flippase)